jgi:Tfp pilus assembly protein PilX
MNINCKQRGFTLMVALIMLVVLTLLVVSAIRSSNTNLRIAGNMQMQEEAVAAAQVALEQTVSLSANFGASAVASTISVDDNNDGTTDYTVNIAKPACLSATPLANNTANLPADCISSGSATNTGIISASGVSVASGQSWCFAQQWEMQASAVSASTGATASVHQGVSLTVPAGQACP